METTTNQVLHTNNKSISIQVSLSGFCFSVYNKSEKKIELEKNLPIVSNTSILAQLSLYFEQYSDHLFPCNDVTVHYDNNLYALVPNTYFDKNKLDNYLKYTVKTYPTDAFEFDNLTINDCKLVYVPFMHINNLLLDYYPTFNYKHKITSFISKCIALNSSKLKTVYCYVNDTSFDVLILDEQKILFCNSFDYQTPQDFLYYILFALEQNKISREDSPVYLIGDVLNTTKVFDLVYTYIRNCKLLQNTENTTHTNSMHFFNLN